MEHSSRAGGRRVQSSFLWQHAGNRSILGKPLSMGVSVRAFCCLLGFGIFGCCSQNIQPVFGLLCFHPKSKRDFATKREAQEWEQKFHQQTSSDMNMTFAAFVEIYTTDLRPRLKENTWLTKENIIKKKILLYFGQRKISEITTKGVITWKNELLAHRDKKRKPYSQSYLKMLHNQLNAIFNYTIRFLSAGKNIFSKQIKK